LQRNSSQQNAQTRRGYRRKHVFSLHFLKRHFFFFFFSLKKEEKNSLSVWEARKFLCFSL